MDQPAAITRSVLSQNPYSFGINTKCKRLVGFCFIHCSIGCGIYDKVRLDCFKRPLQTRQISKVTYQGALSLPTKRNHFPQALQ
ncbi:hypothetical protein D3C78_1794360 [compost metagenome]